MKKLIYILILFLLFSVCGCTSQSENPSNNNSTDSAISDTGTSNALQDENESEQNSYETFERDDIDTEHADDAPHDSRLGERVEATDQTIPENIVGTWRAIEELPEGLEAYNIIIDADANTVQDVERSDGNRTRTVATCIVNGDTYDLVDGNGYLILELNSDGSNLVTDGLVGGSQTVFEKVES